MSESPKILVVEDNLPLLRSLRRLLVADGFEPVLVSSVAAALEALEKGHPFGLLLADTELPDGRIVDVVAAYGAGPVVVCSGHPFERAGLAEAPGERFWYLPKPFDGAELATVVRQALNGRPKTPLRRP